MYKKDKDALRLESLRGLTRRLGLELSAYALLDDALTHASSLAESPEKGRRDYEALEFLGDAVLELAVSHYLFETLPDRSPGDYTKLRATVVNRDCVARVARRIDIAPCIRLGKGEEAGGGRKRIALLADCLEAVIGAVYLDAGWPPARDFVLRVFRPELEELGGMPPMWDYKSQLQNYCQAQHIVLPRFEVVRCDGPDHRKEFEVEVYVLEKPLGRGSGRTKKEAEQRAAQEALFAINQLV
jgi:ribonuclease-3